jgi:hypothetical protein
MENTETVEEKKAGATREGGTLTFFLCDLRVFLAVFAFKALPHLPAFEILIRQAGGLKEGAEEAK